MLMCWRTAPCSSTIRSREPGYSFQSAMSASDTSAGEPSTASRLRPPAKEARYVGMRTVIGTGYLAARARPAALRFAGFDFPTALLVTALLLPALFFTDFFFSVSLCLLGRFLPSSPTHAAFTQTTAGRPSIIAFHEFPPSFDPYTLPLLVPK